MTTALERGEWTAARPGRTLPPRKDPVPIVQEVGWTPGPVWIGAENLATTGIWSPDRPARSQSLYRLRYPALCVISTSRYSNIVLHSTPFSQYTINESYSHHACNSSHVLKYLALTPSDRADYNLGTDIPWDELELHFIGSECSLLPSKLSTYEPYLLPDESSLNHHIPHQLLQILFYSRQPWEINFTETYDN
jgi:hypothetical protein